MVFPRKRPLTPRCKLTVAYDGFLLPFPARFPPLLHTSAPARAVPVTGTRQADGRAGAVPLPGAAVLGPAATVGPAAAQAAVLAATADPAAAGRRRSPTIHTASGRQGGARA